MVKVNSGCHHEPPYRQSILLALCLPGALPLTKATSYLAVIKTTSAIPIADHTFQDAVADDETSPLKQLCSPR